MRLNLLKGMIWISQLLSSASFRCTIPRGCEYILVYLLSKVGVSCHDVTIQRGPDAERPADWTPSGRIARCDQAHNFISSTWSRGLTDLMQQSTPIDTTALWCSSSCPLERSNNHNAFHHVWIPFGIRIAHRVLGRNFCRPKAASFLRKQLASWASKL